MLFDPYLSPHLLPASLPSPASPTPPPASIPFDYKSLVAQKDRVNDALRSENASLRRTLADVKKENSRLSRLLSSRPPLPPSGSSLSPPGQTAAPRAAPALPKPDFSKRDNRGKKYHPPSYDRPTRDIWGGVHAPDDSPAAPPRAPKAVPKKDPLREYEAAGGWLPEWLRTKPDKVFVRERTGMPCDALGDRVGETFGEMGQLVGGEEVEEKKKTPVLEIEAGVVEAVEKGQEGEAVEKRESEGEEIDSEVGGEAARMEAELEAWMNEGRESDGEETSPGMEKKTAPMDGKSTASPPLSSPKQDSDGEGVSPLVEEQAPPINEKTSASPPPPSPKQKSTGAPTSPRPEEEIVPTEAKSTTSSATSSPKRKADLEDDGEKSPPKKTKLSPFSSFATPGPSPFAAPSGSPFGASGFSSFGSGGSFAGGGFAGEPLKVALPLLATKWLESSTSFFENRKPGSPFPHPPTVNCDEQHCAASNTDRALKACPHAVLKVLRVLMEREKQSGGKDGVKAWMKRMRSWWHPDHVANMAGKEKRGEWTEMAKEIFFELGTLGAEMEEKEEEGAEVVRG